MTVLKRLLTLGAAMVPAAALVVAAAPTVWAQPAAACPSGHYICEYTGRNFTGEMLVNNVYSLGNTCLTPPAGYTAFHSVRNTSPYRYYYWEYTNCSGSATGLLQPYPQPGYQYSDYVFTSFRKT